MRLFAAIGGLLVALLVAALVVPPLIDWTSYRADFERAASRLLGQPVTVRGAASARLLPLPRISFEDVTIGGGDDGGGPLLAADRFTLDMELAPLLSGEVRVVSVELDRPRGRIRVRENGAVDWFQRRRDAMGLSAGDVSIEAVRVTDGALELVDEGRDVAMAVTELDAELSARTLAGPWRGTGTFTYDGERYHASGTTGSVRGEGGGTGGGADGGGALRMSTRVTVKPAARPYDVTVAGPLTVTSTGVSLDGTFRLDPASPASLEATPDFLRSRLDEALPVSAEGRLQLSPDRLNVPELVVRVGGGDDPYRLVGSAEAFFEGDRRYRLTLEGAQVDVDQLAAEGDGAGGDTISIPERLAALGAVLSRIPQPDLPGEVRLDLPAVVAGDTVVREVALNARPLARGEGWRIEKLSARLPGRTLVEASGRLGVPPPPQAEDEAPAPFSFEGEVLLASRQPSGFAAWLSRDVDDAIRALPRAGFQAAVAIGPDRARFDDLELQLGADRLSGKLARIAGTEQGRPQLLANLEGDRIDVDTASALFGLFSGATGPSFVAHDLDLRISAGEAVLDGVVARGVDVSLTYDGGDLVVDRLTVDAVAGGAIEARGQVASLYERPRGSLDGRVRIVRGAPFAAFVGDRFALPPAFTHLLREPALLDGTDLVFAFDAASQGVESRLELSLDGQLGSTRLAAVTRYEGEVGALDAGRWNVTVDASNETPAQLFRQLGLAVPPVPVEGEAALTVKLEGPADAFALDATLATPGGTFGTRGQLAYEDGVGDTYEGTFTLVGADVDPLLAATGLAFPSMGLGTPADLAGTLQADATRLALAAKGEAAGTTFDADLALDLDAQPRPALDGRLTLDEFDLVTLASFVWGAGAEPNVWASGAPAPPIGTPVLNGLDGTVRLVAARADLGLGILPAAPARDFAATLALADGDLRLADMRAEWLDGALSGTLALARLGEEGAVSADLELRDAAIAATGLTATGLAARDAPLLAGRFGLDVALEAQGRDLAQLLERLTGAGVLRLDATLRGLEPRALRPILAAADATPDEALEQAAPDLVRERLFAGETPIAVSVPLSIAAGVVRASGVPLGLSGADAVLDLRADLTEATLDGTLRASFETDEAVEGVSPDVRLEIDGTFARPDVRLDATALATFLTTRLRERREREFEAQRAAVLERQRLAREMRLMRESERAYRRRLAEEAERGEPEDVRLQGLPGSPG